MNRFSGKKFGLIIAAIMLPLSQQVLADDGFYVGGALGKAYIDENIDGTNFKADGTSYRISGGYEFNDNFGVEASYLNLGKFDDSFDVGGVIIPVSAKAKGYTLAAVGILPLSDQIFLKARGGVYFYDAQASVGGIVEDNTSDQDGFVGLGLAYDISDRFQLSLDVDYFDMDDTQPLLASLGFLIRF